MSTMDHGLSEENSNESITESKLCLYRTVICLNTLGTHRMSKKNALSTIDVM